MSGHLFIRNEPVQVYVDRIINEAVDKALKLLLEKYEGKPGQVCQLQSDGTMKWVDYEEVAGPNTYKKWAFEYCRRWASIRKCIEQGLDDSARGRQGLIDEGMHAAYMAVGRQMRVLEGTEKPLERSNAGFGLDYF